jgi:hypothetical protein
LIKVIGIQAECHVLIGEIFYKVMLRMCDFDKEFINIDFDGLLGDKCDTSQFLDYTEYKLRYMLNAYKAKEGFNQLYCKLDTCTSHENDILYKYLNKHELTKRRKSILIQQRRDLWNFMTFIDNIKKVYDRLI